MVDPRDIKQLASDLRKAVDSDPDVAKAVDSGKVGIIRFESIDISSPSVAINVVEDLSTALIKNKFKLVERAQFKQNRVIYQPGGIAIPGFTGSFVDYLLRGTEALHATVRRYTSPDEHPFFKEGLPQPLLSYS